MRGLSQTHRLLFIALYTIVALVATLLADDPLAPRARAQETSDGSSGKQTAPPKGPPAGARNPRPAPREEPTYRGNRKLPALPEGRGPAARLDGLKEKPELRSEQARLFRVPGHGIHVAELFPGPANYQLPNGNWRKISTKIVDDDYGYRNGANDFTIRLPHTLTEDAPVVVDIADGRLRFAPIGASSRAASTGRENVRYRDVLPHVHLEYRMTNSGYVEEATLTNREAPNSITYRVDAEELELQQGRDDEVIVLSGQEQVAVFPPPFAEDSNIDRVTGEGRITHDVTQELVDLGAGRYEVSVTVPETWLYDERRQFPVKVDPSIFNSKNPWKDTWVKSNVSDEQSSSTQLKMGSHDGDGWPRAFSYMKFGLADVRKKGDVVMYSDLELWNLYAHSSQGFNINKVTQSWPKDVTWPDRPSVQSTPKWKRDSCSACDWHRSKDIRELLQDWIDNENNRGLRLWGPGPHPDSWKRYSSIDEDLTGDKKPRLYIQINARPTAPSMTSSSIGTSISNTTDPVPAIRTTTPALVVDTSTISDANGDDTYVRFLATSKTKSDGSPDFSNCTDEDTTTKCAGYNSGWIEKRSTHVVPPGRLKDGRKYFWKAQSSDLYDTFGKPHRSSGTRQFKVSLKKLGTDPRWAMWSQQLGNSMQLSVNQGNGNAVLEYPLDSLASPGTMLDLGLTYNSQQTSDDGLSRGWTLLAGPGSDLDELPVRLRRLESGSKPYGVRVTYRSGRRETYPHVSGRVYRQPVAGGVVVRRHPDDQGWTLTTGNGSTYLFEDVANKLVSKLTRARPSTDSPEAPGFEYTYNTNNELHIIRDPHPVPKEVVFDWIDHPLDSGKTVRRLETITAWNGTSWQLSYSGSGKLVSTTMIPASADSVDDPDAETVRFAYPGGMRLGEIRDGEAGSTGPATTISYKKATGWPDHLVTNVTLPEGGPGWTFSYPAGFFGSFSEKTVVVDPRGAPTTDADDYKTRVFFDNLGYPIETQGPRDPQGRWPVHRQQWDARGNLICERAPAAVAKDTDTMTRAQKCQEMGRHAHELELKNQFLTEYFYSKAPPYRLEKVVEPASASGKKRLLRTIAYDGGFQGLVAEYFDNPNLKGAPVERNLWNRVYANWGSGGPGPVGKSDNFSLRWSGLIHNSGSAAKYKFKLFAQDNARIRVGERELSSCWGNDKQTTQANCGNGAAIRKLKKGWTPISVEFQALSGDANVRLEWQRPNSDLWEIVPADVLKPNLSTKTAEGEGNASGTGPSGSTFNANTLSKTAFAYSAGTNEAADALKIRGLPSKATLSGKSVTGESVSFTYDRFGRIKTETDATGEAIQRTYTENGAQTACEQKTMDRVGLEVQRDCNAAGDVTEERVYVGGGTRITNITYDAVGRVEAIDYTNDAAHDLGGVTYSYDSAGRLIRETIEVANLETRVIDHEYNDNGWVERDILPDPDPDDTQAPPDVLHRYDDVGNEIKTTDEHDNVWTRDFDAGNRKLSETDPLGNTWKFVYNPSGNLKKETDPAGVSTTRTYDVLGRESTTTLGGSTAPSKITYGLRGYVTKTEDADGVYTRFSYDAAGRVKKRIEPVAASGGERSVSFVYDDAGFLESSTDMRGHTTTYAHDAMGRMTLADLPIASVGEYTYNQAGELTRVDVKGQTTDTTPVFTVSHTYDSRGRMETETDGVGNTTTYDYNRASELTRVDDPRGYTLRFDYDGRGRKTLRRAEDSNGNVVSEASYGYNATNQMNAARNRHAEVVASYDAAGKLKTVDRGSENTAYSYSNARLSSRTNPAGSTSYGYDGQGRISSVTDPFTGTATTLGYTEAGRLKTRDDASSISHSFSYDPAGRLDHQTSTRGTTEVASFDPIYDASSNVIEQTRQVSGSNDNGTWSYVYDHANRLRDAIGPDSATISYKYDAAGNRTEVTKNSNTTTTTYNQASRPESSSDGTTYDHDAAGNLIQIAASAGTTTYDYDPWNRMTQATVPGDVDSTTLDYTYDALERLITKQDAAVADNTTTYAHSGLQEEVVKLTESDATSSVTSRYLHLGQAPLVMERGGQIRFFGTDPHADVVYLANGSGTLVGDHSYSPWGEKRTASGEDPRFEFQGDLRDEDTGLVDMGARLYSPELGRFTTTDPLRGEADRPITLNRYTYGLDNPVSNVDPTGLYVPQYGHQDRGTKTSPMRAQTASIGTSTSNVAASTRTAGTAALGLLGITIRSQPRRSLVAPRRARPSDSLSLGEACLGGCGFAVWTLNFGCRLVADSCVEAREAGFGNFALQSATMIVGPEKLLRVGRGLLAARRAHRALRTTSSLIPSGRVWRVGQPVDALTRAGNRPAWSTVRARYWKNRAATAIPGEFSPGMLERMTRGRAPLHPKYGVPREIDHVVPRHAGGGNELSNLRELWPWEHADIDPFRHYSGPRP